MRITFDVLIKILVYQTNWLSCNRNPFDLQTFVIAFVTQNSFQFFYSRLVADELAAGKGQGPSYVCYCLYILVLTGDAIIEQALRKKTRLLSFQATRQNLIF